MLATSLHGNTDQEKLVLVATIVWDVKHVTRRKLKIQKEAGFPSRTMDIFYQTIYFHFPDYRNVCIRRRENSIYNKILTFL